MKTEKSEMKHHKTINGKKINYEAAFQAKIKISSDGNQ